MAQDVSMEGGVLGLSLCLWVTICAAFSGIRYCQSRAQPGLTSLEETHRSLGLP